MLLKKFLKENHITQKIFGDMLGVSRISIHKLIKYKTIPTGDKFKKIFFLTNGKVKPNDILPIEQWKEELNNNGEKTK